MDVTVRLLNHRLALQIPRELPLGLVFVVGHVVLALDDAERLNANGRLRHIFFDLVDGEYRVRCLLVLRSMLDVELENGDRVRVGGHLRFDPQKADYFLLARDFERLDDPLLTDEEVEAIDEVAAEALLADIRRRTGQTLPMPEPKLPDWVQEMAPEGMQRDASLAEASLQDGKQLSDETLNDELLSMLSELMDSEEDTELTPLLLAQLSGEQPQAELADSAEPSGRQVKLDRSQQPLPMAPVLEAEPRQPDEASKHATPPPSGEQIDWLVWVLLFALLIVLILVILAVVPLLT